MMGGGEEEGGGGGGGGGGEGLANDLGQHKHGHGKTLCFEPDSFITGCFAPRPH